MQKKLLTLGLLLCFMSWAKAQSGNQNDSSINNLLHTPGYQTCEFGSIPHYIKKGKGKKVMILIAGLGFDASVFADFMQTNTNNYTMYAVTLPGFGNTKAPPMPDTSVSYGEQTWNNSALQGILKLMEKEKLQRPVITGHFVTGCQIAIRIAANYPEKTSGLIILGGPVKLMAVLQGQLTNQPLKAMIRGTDKYWAPVWFKNMRKQFYDDGNFTADIYSLNPKTADILWKQVSSIPMPVAVRYSCEYFASDVTDDISKIKCPVLVLRPSFSDTMMTVPNNKNWMEPQFKTSWDIAAKNNSLVTIKDINGASCFVWKDNPGMVSKEIAEFIKPIKNK